MARMRAADFMVRDSKRDWLVKLVVGKDVIMEELESRLGWK